MASTYSSDIKLELMTTGEKAGTWGTVTNTNLQILEQAASGYIEVNVGAADVALALDNGAVSNGKNLYFKLTGTLTANRTVTCLILQKEYLLYKTQQLDLHLYIL